MYLRPDEVARVLEKVGFTVDVVTQKAYGHGWRAGRRSAKHWFRRAGVALCDVAANRSGQPGVVDDLNGIVDRAVLAAAGDADVASGAARLSARHRSIVISSMGERCCFIRSRITRICGAE